jgi:hypothetical protein
MRGKIRLARMVLPAAFAVLIFVAPRGGSVRASMSGPNYTQNGDLLPPAHYREWIFLSSGLDMSYNNRSAKMTQFDNVFVNADAYRSFLVTGTWPDKTVLVLETREGKDKGSINQSGHYQGTDVTGLEVHLKDKTRFPGKWAFFGFASKTRPGKLIPQTADCYSCHEAHGAVDTTFVQFYPTLLPIARTKQTLSAEFLKTDAAKRE